MLKKENVRSPNLLYYYRSVILFLNLNFNFVFWYSENLFTCLIGFTTADDICPYILFSTDFFPKHVLISTNDVIVFFFYFDDTKTL